MKIGVPSDNGQVFFRLERAKEVTFYIVHDGAIRRKYIVTAEHRVLPLLMREEVDLVVCGDLGMPTERELSMGAIRVHRGSYGDCDKVIARLLESGIAEPSAVNGRTDQ